MDMKEVERRADEIFQRVIAMSDAEVETEYRRMTSCAYCEERVDDYPKPAATINTSEGPRPLHRECQVRMIAGSSAHQLGECSCHGGTREDPPGATLRQGARLAYDTFLVLQRGLGGARE
jgi:hypothetical protein